ncbi:MAG: hypothetical protein KKD63_03495 [Proteobacteria bacterium]|nr:hypothetical protein [Desulfobulbaceae bacterium]MBU4151923.1 hypothetical protein [Pseudomonadota bacterium]MDP2106020.1 hypothetical protein [Desulfobulbaceae bacterium]
MKNISSRHRFRGDVLARRKLRAVGHLTQPIRRDELLNLLSQGIKLPEGTDTVLTRHHAEVGRKDRPVRILVAEDHPVNRKLAWTSGFEKSRKKSVLSG